MLRDFTICLGVCTILRPQMLKKCLHSLAAQQGVENYDVHIVVVDNDLQPNSKAVVQEFAGSSPFPVHYFHEPRRGIPMARNKVLDAALALNAEWIVFVDDDQAASHSFLQRHLAAAKRDNADVVQPHIVGIYPEPAPFWCVGRNASIEDVTSDGPLETRLQTAAGTCGVMFSSRLIRPRPHGMELRFNENLALAGGEDADFFGNAYRLGARIVFSRMPVVMEEVPPSRLTYSRYVMRGLARGGQLFGQYRRKNGYLQAARKYALVSLIRIVRGMGQLLISPVFVPFSMRRFKFTALEGGRNIFLAAGVLGGLFSLQYEYYRRVDGY